MKLVVFGLTVSSSWGNGHATLWRALCRALGQRGHHVVFFERDVAYYRMARDLRELEGGELVLYCDWAEVRERAAGELRDADAAFVTSFCPDGVAASELVLAAARPVRAFYDLDTPVTLAKLAAGERPFYLREEGLAGFDLVLSFTGGRALDALRTELGARRVAALYGHVDPLVHRPVPIERRFVADLSYLGTYAEDRRAGVEELFLEPARAALGKRFLLGGSMYPDPEKFPDNVVHLPHVPPPEHAAFFASSRLTLNVTRGTMAQWGYCPSGRLFEAAASGVPIVSDWFDGLDCFFEPEDEIWVAHSAADVLAALEQSDATLQRRALRARERVFAEHLAKHRADELEQLLASVKRAVAAPAAREPRALQEGPA
jgi:spore maturation protein CgeB